MDKQEKKLKFNIIDVAFVAVVLAGVVFVALRLSGGSLMSDDGPSEEYIITFYVTESADYVVDHLWTGSPLTDDTITLDLGTLVDFETGPARVTSTAADGHVVISDKEGYSSVYLKSRVWGADNGYGVTVDGTKLEIGHTMVVRAREAKFWAIVYDIQKLGDTPYAG